MHNWGKSVSRLFGALSFAIAFIQMGGVSPANAQSFVTAHIGCFRTLNPYAGFSNGRENCSNTNPNGLRSFSNDLSRVNGGTLYEVNQVIEAALQTAPNSLDTYSANLLARVDYGALGASTSTTLSNGEFANLGQSNQGVESLNIDAIASVAWYDSVFVDAPSLADLSSVRVRVTQIIDIHALAANTGNDGSAYSILESYFGAQQLGREIFTSAKCVFLKAGNISGGCNPADQTLGVGRNVFNLEFDVFANRKFDLRESLSVASGVYNFRGGLISGASDVNAFNTARAYLTVLTPGASLVSASGHDYALPVVGGVPEPASWALMLAGFGMIGFTLRTRSKPIVA